MKQLLLILFLATNICVAQKKIAIVITGYDTTMEVGGNVNFVDTFYYHVAYAAMSVFEKDSIYYDLYAEVYPKDITLYEFCEVHSYTDYYGSSSWLNVYDVVLYIARQKLLHLGKL